jgi:ABC-type glutathione transport system ATPase component
VHKQIKLGLLESVYIRCLQIEIEEKDIKVRRELQLPVAYKGKIIHDLGFCLDMLVEDQLVVELKSVQLIEPLPTIHSSPRKTSPKKMTHHPNQTAPSETLVKVEGVSKKFCRDLKKSLWYGMQDLGGELLGRGRKTDELRAEEFWAVKDVSFELKRGECLGLIGRNGAGKTTLLRMLNGLIKPDKGRIEMRGRV